MTARRQIKLTILALLVALVTQASAQDYQLGWDQINKSNVNVQKSYTLDWNSVDKQVDRNIVPVPVAAPANIAVMPLSRVVAPQPQRQPQPNLDIWKKRQPIPVYNVEVAAAQFYDAYADRYKLVAAVEVATNRNGNVFCETFENVGECTTYEVFLRDLRPGDSYSATIVWEDGSNRTIEKTIGGYSTEENVFVDQPDFMAYDVWR